MKDVYGVKLTDSVQKKLHKLPLHIVVKLQAWVDDIQYRGLRAVRKIPGHHDEPLKGKRKGQRSIRLSRSYRAIYIISEQGAIEFIEIIEVNKHEY